MELKRINATREGKRLHAASAGQAEWKHWGPYLSERAWGTVREDYSPGGTAWDYFPHDHARSRVYRWNEDGLGGICDRHQHICFALALWNGRDPILKERAFGLTNSEGNHGEDVKEQYFYLDSTPTHSYMKYLYRYPQAEFPYQRLLEENRRRGIQAPEFELVDTGIFDGNRFFDVFVEYAKAAPDDILVEITVVNRAAEAANLELLPTVWFRNRWSWDPDEPRPELRVGRGSRGWVSIDLDDVEGDPYQLHAEGAPQLLFTENETNTERLYGQTPRSPYVKDAFHELIVRGKVEAVNPAMSGTKAAARYTLTLDAGQTVRTRLRLTRRSARRPAPFSAEFGRTLKQRKREADEFYATVVPPELSADAQNVARQALGGLLWSKQYYHYEVARWLEGDPTQPAPPPERLQGRNRRWRHLHNADVLSVPDKWEFPWYASWDLAFHCVVLSMVDWNFAKNQLRLLLREWYMHPNGQIPAYEWSFDDVNPPVHAWAAMRVYQMERLRTGVADRAFLEAVFHKLLLNFNWWVNRKDVEGDNIFEGGFLGLDNIGIFDRNTKLPPGYILGQSDGTSWMAMYCLNMLAIAVELAREDDVYEDVAIKFWEHFLFIADAMYHRGLGEGMSLWNEEDGFFYDVVRVPSGEQRPIKVLSLVGLVPLLATAAIDYRVIDRFPALKERVEWFMSNKADLAENVVIMHDKLRPDRALLSVVKPDQLQRVLRYLLDENHFLSPHGIRSVSRHHLENPYTVRVAGTEHTLEYQPGESRSGIFGGNSNWRGPVWMPLNYLLIESLQRFAFYFGGTYKVECPTGSGKMMALDQVTVELSRRLSSLYLRDAGGRRAVFGDNELLQTDQLWCDYLPFHEYFHGDTGAGLGAAHQTGWTALVAKLIQQSGSVFAQTDASPFLLRARDRARPPRARRAQPRKRPPKARKRPAAARKK